MTDDKNKLLACPFCGGVGKMLDGEGRWFQIGCDSCGARGCEYPGNPEKAIDSWNARANPDLIEQLCGALEFVKHRDARWHGDEVVTPALEAAKPYRRDKP